MKLFRRGILLILALCLIAAVVVLALRPAGKVVFSPEESPLPVVILDAGHGGIDGGAVSADGIVEREVNLEITKRLALLMLFCGQRVALTRTDANDLSSPDAKSTKEQKVSDLKNRVAAVNSVPNATLISIHQNSLAGHPEVRGAQVFYNTVPGSDSLAICVQQRLNQDYNSSNARSARQIDSSIYLMSEVHCPAILVECGFLSNSAEAHALCTPAYQKQIALAISAGYLAYTNEGST